jgi:hypothetical protein
MRSTLDKLISWTGILIAVVLLVAGGLLTWGWAFVGDQVHSQFQDQDITMPAGQAITSLPDKADQDALQKYAKDGNNLLDSGPEAKAYADHYIHAHLGEAVANLPEKTYSAISSSQMKYCASDNGVSEGTADQCTTYTGLKAEFFQGNTLRGLLLYGYAFATIGTIAGIAAIAAYAGAVVFLVLGLLGLLHARRLHGKPGPARSPEAVLA